MTVRIPDELCTDLEEYLKHDRRNPVAHRLLGRLIQAREQGDTDGGPPAWPALEINGEWFHYGEASYEPQGHCQSVTFLVPAARVPSLAQEIRVNATVSSVTLWPSALAAKYRFFGPAVVALTIDHGASESVFHLRFDADEPRPEHSNG